MDDGLPGAGAPVRTIRRAQIARLARARPRPLPAGLAHVPEFDALRASGAAEANGVPLRWVERVEYGAAAAAAAVLSPRAFVERYFARGVPVLLAGAARAWRANRFTERNVLEACAATGGRVARVHHDGAEWGRLKYPDELESWGMETYFEYLRARERWIDAHPQHRTELDPGASLYMTDIDVCFVCPGVATNTTALPYWSILMDEYVEQHHKWRAHAEGKEEGAGAKEGGAAGGAGAAAKDPNGEKECSGVNLFSYVGGRGSGTFLHQDSAGINFWMSVISGKKEMVLFSPADARRVVGEQQHAKCSPDGFCPGARGAALPDFYRPDFERFPGLRDATAWLAVIEPGDVLFGPAMWFHQARNTAPRTFGITGNFHQLDKGVFTRELRSRCRQRGFDFDDPGGRTQCARHLYGGALAAGTDGDGQGPNPSNYTSPYGDAAGWAEEDWAALRAHYLDGGGGASPHGTGGGGIRERTWDEVAGGAHCRCGTANMDRIYLREQSYSYDDV